MPKLWYFVVAAVLLLTFLTPKSTTSLLHHANSSPQANTCEIPTHTNVCAYINKQCDSTYFLIAKLYYCAKTPSLPLLLLILLGILLCLIVVLTSLSVVVSNFLFRNLNELTTTLKINNKILSFILIPLTNTFLDLINYYVILDSGSPNLVLGQLVGSILIMFTVIIGLISILTSPYNVLHHKMLLIDFLWVLFVLVIFVYILSDSKITLFECLFMVTCYGLYILFLNYFDKEKINHSKDSLTISPCHSNQEHPYNIEDALDLLSDDECPKSPDVEASADSDDSELHESIDILQLVLRVPNFLFSLLIPINLTEAELEKLQSNFAKVDVVESIKIWFSIEIPLLLNYQFLHIELLNIIPVVLLTIIFMHYISRFISYSLGTIIVNFLGVFTSIIVLSNISVLVLQILKNFGMLWKMSDYLLGLLVFSISNSITDIITNITISTKIEPILGINACLGTPILMILLGIGVNGFVTILKSGTRAPLEFTLKLDVVISTLALTVIVAFYLIYLPLNDWVFDKRAGAFALGWYFLITGMNFYLER
ncbi:uncharacterized protein CANTADRAFT_48582 [Suhomyces tanzawaensis NRRL Y-17324]|uniref:Sodium/calcium exchanger membrane region domain-containing protein n=1 Tax=Suhomyces tanzawaensis NRRL Y-17324 TaxID=984487 RepID=A0A1E4SKA6_9ASCO|nr:uncharacterized protein CANTADRAFT_48582 [Suhomyces tanzawaensis NRRL Y-17324]ODV79928.1 hypothetical protein CANTADRAFT_48582 [Suhomyces tanzawaensis NRRL Y-17324]